MKSIKALFEPSKKPQKGLYVFEWAAMIYLFATLAITLFCYTDLVNPGEMLTGRIRALIITLVVWGVYRMLPCRMMVILRVAAQSSLLPWWYADTYEINRILPNLDHVFAAADQWMFGFQPSLYFSQACPWTIFSEYMYLGYYSYFYLVLATSILYYIYRNDEFVKAVSVITVAFFLYYIFFDFVPVVGPQYYYQAIGLDNVVNGVFPDVGNYFRTHQELFPAPGSEGDFFRSFVESGTVRDGERPTAAFPSSHIGLSTVVGCMIARLCWQRRRWWPMYVFIPLFIGLTLATVYIHAHYVIDGIFGFLSGVALYFILWKTIKKQ